MSTDSPETETLVKPTNGNAERSVILTIIRKKTIVPMHFKFELKNLDLATVAIYKPEREQALAHLAKAGWTVPPPLILEELLRQPHPPSPIEPSHTRPSTLPS